MKKHSFTMAEILISLTIIGVIAAITLPSLRANINESTWATQRKALYSRLSQALSMLPSLNGYGSVVGRNGTSDDGPNGMVITYDDAAKTFLTKGLSTVLKINNICDSEHLMDCGFPSTIKTINGKRKIELSSISTFMGLHGIFYSQGYYHDTFYGSAGAFETANGESILVHYNPYCQDNKNNLPQYTQPFLCANFIYDLNGKKGPNKVGKDIGFITALYPTDSVVVAPMPDANDSAQTISYQNALKFCKDKNMRMPNIDELTAMAYNFKLINGQGRHYLSGTLKSNKVQYVMFSDLQKNQAAKSSSFLIRCIYK